MHPLRSALIPVLLLSCACSEGAPAQAQERPFQVEEMARFAEPWAMAFLPGGRQALVTEKAGRLKLWTMGASAVDVAGVPGVDYGGQGGLGDVVLAPDFATSGMVYLSFAEAGEGGTRGAAVGRGRLVIDGAAARLEGFAVIWRQVPKFGGRARGHYGHRLAFSPDGRHLFISSGERQQFAPAQDMASNAGKLLRLNPDGTVPPDNPFASQSGVAAEVWTLGHRNPLGLAFAPDGRLWVAEMGPQGGDELNLVIRGRNYGYPNVSNGDHYDGRPIPDHSPSDGFEAPKVTWTPVISPGGMIVYSGLLFPAWRGDALLGGLSGQALVRVDIDGEDAREAERWGMGARIREVEQGPDGAVWLLEDQREPGGTGGRLLRLTPRR